MPYIKHVRAQELNPDINSLIEKITKPGELNYVISRLADGLTRTIAEGTDGTLAGYSDMSQVRAVFFDAADEYYRQIMAPYEDNKRKMPDSVGLDEIYYRYRRR